MYYTLDATFTVKYGLLLFGRSKALIDLADAIEYMGDATNVIRCTKVLVVRYGFLGRLNECIAS